MLEKKELEEVLTLSKGSELKYDESLTWLDLFKEQVKKDPGHIAVADEFGSFTYEELDRMSDELAAALIEVNGVKPDDFVAVRIDRLKEFFVAVIAIHKAGAAYLPIDLESPAERTAYMMHDSGARLTLTKKKVLQLCRTGKNRSVLPYRCRQDGRAYMIYTSGSTGEPKGVVIPQRALTNFVHAIMHQWGLTENSRIALHANFAFDASVEDIFPPLCAGGSVFIIPERIRKDIFEVRDFITKNQINGGCYSTLFGQLLAMDEPLDVDYFCLGGEAMTVIPKVRGRIFNSYGPTEFTVDATWHELEKDREYENIPIGRPLSNCAAYIVNDRLELVSRGETGELCLSGPQLALGYHNRPELTKEKFTTIDLLNGERVKIYRTGDLARWNEEGELEYAGRIDTQVKLRGFRVELGEIERCATLFTGMSQAAAEVRKEILCLYYTASRDVKEEELKNFMAGKLADFMVPRIFIKMEKMPETANGKIDRKKLPEPVYRSAGEYVAPASDKERIVVEIMAEVLSIREPVSVTHDFFELGGDSIKAIRMASLIRSKGYFLSVADVMRGHTAMGIAGLLRSAGEEKAAQDIDVKETVWSEESIKAVCDRFEKQGEKVERIYPLTPMQEGMLLEHVSHPESFAYRIADIYECTRRVDEKELRRAVDALAKRHETLRSAILYNGQAEPRQAVIDRTLPVTYIDRTDASDIFEELMRLRTDILKTAFDPENKPLTQFVYVRYGKPLDYLIFVSHHIITDGWSFDVLIKDFNALLRGEEIPEGIPGLYERVVRRQLSLDRDAAVNYFTEMLSGYENYAGIPFFGGVPEKDRSKDDQFCFTLPSADKKNLSELCQRSGATLSDGFNLTWGLVLKVLNRIDDVGFTTIASGRDGFDMDLSDSVGLFLNPVPVRADFSNGTETARTMLRKLREQANASKAYDFCPLADIQDALGGGIRLAGFNISFENFSEPDTGEAALVPMYLHEDHDAGDGVGVDAIVQPDGSVYIILIYNPVFYRRTEMERLSVLFENVVRWVTKNPNLPLSRLEPAGRDDLNELMTLSKGEELPVDDKGVYLSDFRNYVKKTPDQPAVTDNDGQYTYAELDRASDSVASYLIGQGVKEDDFVAVRMGRKKEFFASVIGIHKAGAAYVPVDPEYPKERVDYMIRDSGAKLILTEEDVNKAIAAFPDPAPVNRSSYGHPAYMIYTSGSTGLPKGVVIGQRSLNYFVHFIAHEWGLGADSRIALHSSFSFDAAVEDMFPALTVGGKVFVVPEDVRKDISMMREYIRKNRINGGCYSTQFGQLLGMDETPLDVDYLVLGGEAMTQIPNVRGRVINTYGPTEFTVDATFYEIEKGRVYGNIPIGRPLYNCSAYIVNSNLSPVPRGVVGELCLAGPQMADGYWKRPELNAAKFTTIGTGNGETVKVYRTGDLARWNEEGQLEFVGRVDAQVKLRGFRIEPGEVEKTALKFEPVKEAAVLIKKETLCLYYRADGEVDEKALKDFMALSLADYMVPGAFIRMEKMPLTPAGKVDRRALPEPGIEKTGKAYAAPVNGIEKKLCDAFGAVLELDPDTVGRDDDFFDLGGNSIRGMRLVLFADIDGFTTSDLFRLHTPKKIAEKLMSGREGFLPSEEKIARKLSVPATVGQISMIDYQFVHIHSVMYNVSALYRFPADTDVERLKEAVKKAILNHPALGSVLELNEEGIVVQRYRPERIKEIPLIDVPEEKREETLKGLVRPFRLFKEPLFRACLYRFEDGIRLFMDMHHVICDGSSLQILLGDIALALKGQPLSRDYYYTWLLNEMRSSDSEEYAKADRHFKALLGDHDWCSVPTPDFDTSESDLGVEREDMGLTLKDMSAAEERLEASGNVLCITAGILALQEYCRRSDILVTWINSNRTDMRYEDTVGLFFRSLPVAVHTEQFQSLKALILEIKNQVASGFANSICNYMETIPSQRVLDDDMEINYLIGLGEEDPLEAVGAVWEEPPFDSENTYAGERVGVYIDELDGNIFTEIAYQKKAYADGSMARFLAMFKKYLRYIVLNDVK